MKNPTGVDKPVSQAHGADATYQYGMATNEDKLAAILAEIFGFKPSVYDVQLLKETMRTRLGVNI